MTPDDALAQTADIYRRDGYAVEFHPAADSLPPALRRPYPALVARRNGKAVYAEVWERDRVHDLPPDPLPTGWNYDAVLLPADEPAGAPGPGAAATPEFTAELLAELENYVPLAARQGRFLLAWSAAEAAMRVAARREGLSADRLTPRELLSELVSAGLLDDTQADAATGWMAVRNRLAHGVPVEPVSEATIRDMVGLARGLIAPPPVAA